MIVRNEADNLAACLTPIAREFAEIIVVDTGSIDGTKELAAQFGAKVYDFAWIDNFAAARNECVRHASGDWIFWFDADDRLDQANLDKFRRLLQSLPDENHAYVMRQWSAAAGADDSSLIVDHVRLFRNQPRARWRYRVHEQIQLALHDTGAKLIGTDIVIRHLGYRDPGLRGRKLERNLRLLQMELAENSDESFVLFNLAATYLSAGRLEEAVSYLDRCLKHAQPEVSFLPKAYVFRTRICHAQGKTEEGLRRCRAGKKRFPDYPELWFEEGLLLQTIGDSLGAKQCYEQVLAMSLKRSFVAVEANLCGCRTRHNLAMVCRNLKQDRQAEEHWLAAIAETPEFGQPWLGLVEILLSQKRDAEVEALCLRLAATPHGDAILPAVQARIALTRQKYAIAKQILEVAIARSPGTIWLRSLLSDILLRVGKDPEGAEKQLQAILLLDPNQASVRQKVAEFSRRTRIVVDLCRCDPIVLVRPDSAGIM